MCYLITFKCLPNEPRTARHVRNPCIQVGFWSDLWAKRVMGWNDHIQRGETYNHICNSLIQFKNAQWLTHERSKWVAVSSFNSRNTPLAGRTGTRCNIGGPQPRWEHGLAKQVLAGRNVTEKGNNAMAIGSRIRNAMGAWPRQINFSWPRCKRHW